MAKTQETQTITRTRSIDEIAEAFATITVGTEGALRLEQSRLAYEFIGGAEGSEASELRDIFRKNANDALRRHQGKELSQPGVTNLVNTWKYMLRANVVPTPDVARASFSLASQTFRKKEENYVIPAIEAITQGMDPVKAFSGAVSALLSDKKADRDAKAEGRPNDGTDRDESITVDTVMAVLQMIPSMTFSDDEKSSLRDLLATASVAVAE